MAPETTPATVAQPERPAQPIQPAKPEAKEAQVPHISEQLAAQIALGNFKKDASPQEIQDQVAKQPPKEVSEDTYKALQAQHDVRRNQDAETSFKRLQEMYKQLPPEIQQRKQDPTKMSEKQRFNELMTDWVVGEDMNLRMDLEFAKRGGPEKFNLFVNVMTEKFGFALEQNPAPHFAQLDKVLFDNHTNTTGTFYDQFCRGDTNKALAAKLKPQEMLAAKGFLIRLLGSTEAFDALVALRQTQDNLRTNNTLSPAATDNQLKQGEDKILDFYRNGLDLANKKTPSKSKTQSLEPQLSGAPDKDISISVGQLATDPNRNSIPIKPPEKKSGPQTQYTESLLTEKPTKDSPAPPMRILADQLNKTAAHFRDHGVKDPVDLAFLVAKNFGHAGIYQKIVEQHAFGPTDFERSKDKATNFEAAKQNINRVEQLTQEAKQNGERVIVSDTWYHYFSPHTPDQRPETQYRIYLNPDTAKFPAVLESLLRYAKDNDLYFKTPDPRDPNLFTRLDTIVVYLNEQNADKVTHFIQDELFNRHQDAFQGRAAPGSSTVTIRPGIGLADQPSRGINGAEITAGQRNARKIEEALETFSLDEIKRTMARFSTEAAFVASPEYKLMKNAINSVRYMLMPDTITHSSETSELFADSLLHVAYGNAQGISVTADFSNSPVIRLPMDDVLSTFKQKLQAKGYSQLATSIDALSPQQLNYQYESPCTLSNRQFTRAALAINLYARLQNHQDLGGLFLDQYDSYAAASGRKTELTQTNLALRSLEKYPGANEDHAFLHDVLQMGGMFDGMGGHAHGKDASRMAMQIIEKRLSSLPDNASLVDVQTLMQQSMKEANDQVVDKYPGSGTTGSVFKIWTSPTGEKKMVVANVGDSRTWVKKKDGTLRQLTTDDNQVKSLLRVGRITLNDYYQLQKALDRLTSPTELNQTITLEDGSTHTLQEYWDQSGITRSIGQKPFKMDPIQTFDIEAGDMVFYTSDGVHDNLSTNEILQIIKDAENPQELTDALTQAAYGVSQLSKVDDYRAKEDDITAGALLVA